MARLIVLIPHYNNLDGLYKSIQSIDEKIEVDVLVVDDGSRNPPKKTELENRYNQGTIFLELMEKNQGVEHASNLGLSIIEKKQYEFIGKLDAGDLNHKNKYTKQIAYLDKNKQVFLLGTWAKMVSMQNEFLFYLKHPVSYKTIKKKMFLNCMFINPSVVFRTVVIREVGYYPTNYKSAEDYAFLFNVVERFKCENYPEILLDYVVDPNSISSQNRKQQVKSRIRIILKHFRFGFYPVYGLLRSMFLLFVSRETSDKLKKRVFK